MKKLFTLISTLFFSLIIFAQADSAYISFDKTTHDFGTLQKGGNTTCLFKFQNTGKTPLILSRCQQSCGCTTPYCPQKAILPGEWSHVEVHYDSLRIGPFTKTVTVNSNAQNSNVVLTIKGNIEEAKPAGEK